MLWELGKTPEISAKLLSRHWQIDSPKVVVDQKRLPQNQGDKK